MKKLLFILLFIPLILFSQETKVKNILNYDTIVEYIKITDETGYYNGEPLTGVFFRNYKSGVRAEFNFKDGKLDGLFELFYENGQLKEEKNYKEGKYNGLQEKYDENGKLEYKAYYKNDKIDGIEMQYVGEGILLKKSNYKDGKKDGLTEFYENGEISQRINYKNNTGYFIDGVFELINDAGTAVGRIVTYKDGKKDGLEEVFYENGQLSRKSNYKDGKKDGLFQLYYENGQLLRQTYYTEGEKDGLFESYHENGRLSAKILYKNGVFTTQLIFTIGEIDIRNVNFYDLEPMIKLFLKDCEENNIKLSSDYKITSTFETLDKGKVALSYGIFNDKEIIIKVSPQEWRKASKPKRWYILYHELGHDVLNLKHGQGGKMMFNFTEEDYTWYDFLEDKYYMFNSMKR